MSLKKLQELERNLSNQVIELLEDMNNFLYVNRDDYESPVYLEKSKNYRSVARELEHVRIQIAAEKYAAKVGRPQIGVGKPVKITLPEDEWQKISTIVENGHATSVADYFRQLHQHQHGGVI